MPNCITVCLETRLETRTMLCNLIYNLCEHLRLLFFSSDRGSVDLIRARSLSLRHC